MPGSTPNSPEDRWQGVHEILQAALARPVADRAAFLDDVCADDEQLRREVESLLAAADRGGPFDRLAERFAVPADSIDDDGPVRAGPFRLVRELGRGGMGVVYEAVREDDQLGQRVALKLFHAGARHEQLVDRFLAEREILARLDHPNIARVQFGGITDDGRPYFAMEYVDGVSVIDHCDTNRLSINDRIAVFLDICQAVHYAHRHLVVHRDLKPSNVLVTAHREVKLLDFGIAKLLDDADGAGDPSRTETGLRLMTPQYASPEQVLGEPVTTATDIYQLGVLLYELLSGRRPYELSSRLPHEVQRVICTESPDRPSAAATRAAGGDRTADASPPAQAGEARRSTAERLRRRLAGDLDTIVLMAMRKEPERRYATVEALADDLRRHLGGLPVRAQPDTLAYRATKFVRRHRLGVASAALIVLLISTFGVTMAAQAGRIARERDRAQDEAAKAEQVAEVLAGLFRAGSPQEARGETLTAGDLLARGVEDVEALSDQPDVQAHMFTTLGWSYHSLGQYDEAEQLIGRGLDLRRSIHPEGHVDIATSLNDLAATFLAQARYDDVEPLLREALEIHRTVADGDSIGVADALDNLAVLQERRGDFVTAEQLHREALALYRLATDEADPKITRTLNNLAFVIVRQARYTEGVTLYHEVIDRLRREYPGDHPNVAHTLNNLGTAYRRLENHAAADSVYREALAVSRRVFGDEHPAVAATLNNRGIVLRNLGRIDEAEAHYREALAMRRKLLGDEHPAVATTLNNLAVLHRANGELELAEPLYLEAVELQRRTLGAHPGTATSLYNLGRLYEQMGRFVEAERILREALAMQQDKLPPDHPDISGSQLRLAHLLGQLGRFPEADSLLLDHYGILKAELGSDNPRTLEIRDRIINIYESWGRPEEATRFR